MIEHQAQAQVFSFSGGRPCLDFANTLDDRATEAPHERLNSYRDLVAWGQQAQLVTDEEAQRLREEAEHHPREAKKVLQHAIALREAMFRIFRAVAEDTVPEAADLALLNTALAEAMAHTCIVPEVDGFTWQWANEEQALDRVLWPVVRSAADILTSQEVDAVHICASDDCNWLFFDTSKNHSRRWCDMKGCGNRAKARRHYERKK